MSSVHIRRKYPKGQDGAKSEWKAMVKHYEETN
jgi:hypothetical protein